MKISLSNLYSVDNKLLTCFDAVDHILNDRLELLDHLIDTATVDNDHLHKQRDLVINLLLVNSGKTEERKLPDGCYTIIKT